MALIKIPTLCHFLLKFRKYVIRKKGTQDVCVINVCIKYFHTEIRKLLY